MCFSLDTSIFQGDRENILPSKEDELAGFYQRRLCLFFPGILDIVNIPNITAFLGPLLSYEAPVHLASDWNTIWEIFRPSEISSLLMRLADQFWLSRSDGARGA